MSKKVKFEGVIHQFPDDATDEEIRSALEGGSTPRPSGGLPFDAPPAATLAEQAKTTMARRSAPQSTLDTAYQYSGLKSLVEGGKGFIKEGAKRFTDVANTLGGVKGTENEIPSDFFGFNTAPSNPFQSGGAAIEQAAEFALPDTLAAKATKALPLATRMIARGATGAGVGMIQGQGPGEAAVSGALMGIPGPAAEAAWPAAKDFVARKITPRMMNALMKVSPDWLQYGRDPGGRIVKEGLVAGSKDGLHVQVVDKVKESGRALEALLVNQGAGKTIDADPIVAAAIQNATKRIGRSSDPAFQAALQRIETDIQAHAGKPLSQLSPLETNRLKTAIGESVQWNGEQYESDLNKVLLEIYRGLNNATETAVPGAKSIMARYGDLKVAEKALEASIRKDMTKPLVSGQGLFANLSKPLNSTPVATRTAQMLNRFDPNKNLPSRLFGRMGAGGAASQLSPEDE